MKGCERMHLKNVMSFLGVWAYPYGLIVSGLIFYLIQTMQMKEIIFNAGNVTGIILGGLAAPFLIMITNLYDWYSKGKTDFTPNLTFRKNVTKISNSKRQAMYKKVVKNDKLLTNKPEGLILGKQGKKFVCLPMGKEGQKDGVSAVVLGSPGSGKSVFLTNFLLNTTLQLFEK